MSLRAVDYHVRHQPCCCCCCCSYGHLGLCMLLVQGHARANASTRTHAHGPPMRTQEHVGEYGVHWNFFASIAVVTLLAHVVRVRRAALPALAAGVTAAHQAVLSWGGVGAWALAAERDPSSLLDLNKEGLASVLGYWALHLWGAAAAAGIGASLQRPLRHMQACLQLPAPACEADGGQPRGRKGAGKGWERQAAAAGDAHVRSVGWVLRPLLPCLAGWAALDAVLWGAAAAVEAGVQPVSRRLCNAAFILWVVAFCGALLLPLLVAQVLLRSGLRPWLPSAFSSNMLPLFLAANLATGAINLGVDTLRVPDGAARLVVGAYAAAVCGLAAALDAWGIRLDLKRLATRKPETGKAALRGGHQRCACNLYS